MDGQTVLIILACSAAVHFVLACVMGIYARYKSQYLSLMWVDGLFAFALVGLCFISGRIAEAQPVIMHPLALFVLAEASFLQSVYPLGVTMPGFLSWGRMLRYSAPALVLPAFYFALTFVFGETAYVENINQLGSELSAWDLALRVIAVALSGYYIVNIYRLPRVMARSTEVPAYLLGYCTALSLGMCYYMLASIFYSPMRVGIYIIIFTFLNIYLVFRTLEEIALHLPLPRVADVPEATDGGSSSEAELEKLNPADDEDFNQANMERFQRLQFWMQHHREVWVEASFGRDRLCETVGLNRHLLLQTLRSQGFNNTHEYLMTYRVAELKRLIRRGEIQKLSDAVLAGFGTVVTARSSFQKVEGVSLDAYLQSQLG